MATCFDEVYTRGIHEGRAEGEARGMAKLLSRQLQQRFGALSPQRERQLAEASPADLDAWGARLFEASTVEAVFGG